jgi:hypothetical protein
MLAALVGAVVLNIGNNGRHDYHRDKRKTDQKIRHVRRPFWGSAGHCRRGPKQQLDSNPLEAEAESRIGGKRGPTPVTGPQVTGPDT